jgi:transposase
MPFRPDTKYITVFADLDQKRVIFAVPGKDKSTWNAFGEELSSKNGHPHAILFAAIDMSKSYQSGVRNNCRNAQIVFDKFHVMKIVNERVDAVRKGEFVRGTTDAKKQLKGTIWLWRKNPSNLNEKEQAHLGRIDQEYLWTAKAYQMRLSLQNIYNNIPYRSWAERRLKSWCNWVTKVASKAPNLLMKPMVKVVETIQNHWDGILAYWSSGKMTTAFMEGLNSVFSAVKRRARGYRNPQNLITMLYFITGKLDFNSGKYH